jgi:hypothetical protein
VSIWVWAWILVGLSAALAALAEYYRTGRDDMAAWCLFISAKVWEDDKTAEEILGGLKSFVIDKSEL